MGASRVVLVALALPLAAFAVTLPPTTDAVRSAGHGAAVERPDPKELPALIESLSSDSAVEREEATRALVAAGPVARPLLRKALESPDPEVRWRAAYALAAIEEVVDRPDRDPARALFAEAVSVEKDKAKALFRQVIERFPGTRWAAAAKERLAERPRGQEPRREEKADAESLVAKLSSPRWAERQAATIRLAEMGEAARPALEKAAGSLDPAVAWQAKRLLERLGSSSRRPAPQARRPRSPNAIVELFGENPQRPPVGISALEGLVARLSDDDPWQVARARLAIEAIGLEATDALIRALETADEVTAVEIMDLLRRVTGCRLGFRRARWLTWWREQQERGGE